MAEATHAHLCPSCGVRWEHGTWDCSTGSPYLLVCPEESQGTANRYQLCRKCGAEYASSDARYCSVCGSAVQEPYPRSSGNEGSTWDADNTQLGQEDQEVPDQSGVENAKPAEEPAGSLMRCNECDIVSRDREEMAEHYRDTLHPWSLVGDVVPSRKSKFDISRFDNAHFVFGLFFLLCGGAITLITYILAAPGGAYFILWGAMAFGVFEIIRGLVAGRD